MRNNLAPSKRRRYFTSYAVRKNKARCEITSPRQNNEDTSSSRRTRLFDGSVLAVRDLEKHSATLKCDVYALFLISRRFGTSTHSLLPPKANTPSSLAKGVRHPLRRTFYPNPCICPALNGDKEASDIPLRTATPPRISQSHGFPPPYR